MDEHRSRISEAFEAIEQGKQFVYRRTFTDGDVAMFCGVTGDLNPYHQDDAFAAASPFGRRIVPGLLTGSMATHIGGLLGFLATEMHFEFLAGVHVGDTVTCTVTFTERDEVRRRLTGVASFVNQDGVEVLRGTFRGRPSLVRLA
ncbi:MAG TPA: MaoC family dehydratase [Candidatus Dormibacteraeota bacterium]|jgi:acyl dehydratase